MLAKFTHIMYSIRTYGLNDLEVNKIYYYIFSINEMENLLLDKP